MTAAGRAVIYRIDLITAPYAEPEVQVEVRAKHIGIAAFHGASVAVALRGGSGGRASGVELLITEIAGDPKFMISE